MASTSQDPVVVLTTGGTIESTRTARGVIASAAGERTVAGSLADADLPVRVEPLVHLNSYAIETPQILMVAQAAVAAAERAPGVVVTHGTDTLEESAYLTDLHHDGPGPIVFTGAQRHADQADSDGPANVQAAVKLAGDERLRGAGVLVAMDGRVDAARDAVKVHTHASRAFGGGEAGPVAELGPNGVKLMRLPRRRPPVRPEKLDARVALVKLGAGDDGLFVDAAREAGVDGIVLEAFGLGNANPPVVERVRNAVSSGVVVLVTSRCAAGGVAAVYGGGGAVDLVDAGAILAGATSAVKARILLMAALSASASSDAALAIVREHL